MTTIDPHRYFSTVIPRSPFDPAATAALAIQTAHLPAPALAQYAALADSFVHRGFSSAGPSPFWPAAPTFGGYDARPPFAAGGLDLRAILGQLGGSVPASCLGAFDPSGYASALGDFSELMRRTLLIRASTAQRGVQLDPGKAVAQGGPRFAEGAAIFAKGDDAEFQKFAKEKLHMEWVAGIRTPDMKTAGRFLDKIKGAQVKLEPARPGGTPPADGGGKVSFSAAEAQRIQRAMNSGGDAAGKQAVLQILSEKTGEPIFDDPQELDKEYSSRLHKYDVKTKYDHLTDEQLAKRDIMTSNTRALNKLFGTKVPANENYKYSEKDSEGRKVEKVGHGNKRGLSTAVLDDLATNVVEGMKRGMPSASIHASFTESFFGMQTPGWLCGGTQSASARLTVPVSSQGFSVDASSYLDGIKHISELHTPLVFDLEGAGFKIKDAELVPFDIDADGRDELVSDLPQLGVLVLAPAAGEPLTGKHLFGGHTDLSRFGVVSSDVFENGYQALHALVAHFGPVGRTKRHLDAGDLRLLEERVGLRMRVGGLKGGRDLRFADLGITRIELGRLEDVQSLGESAPDMWFNRAMLQKGATFVVGGQSRPYADLWFNVQARAVAPEPKAKRAAVTVPAVARRV